MSDFDELLDTFEDRNPGALELAEAVSFAVRIEPGLLREIRLKLLQHLDVGAEADVWLSPLVQTRSPEGVVFNPDAAAALRQRLYKRPDGRFRKAWILVKAFHEYLSEAIQFEEKIAWLSAQQDDPQALKTIDELLRQATSTIVSDKGGEGLINWAARALPQLPPGLRNLEGARMLAMASYLRLAKHLPLAEGESNQPLPDWLDWVLPGSLPETWVRLRLVSGGVELTAGPKTDTSIPVPDTRPSLVELSWTEDGEEKVEQVALQPGERRIIQTKAGEIVIRTLVGNRYQLTPAPKPPVEENRMEPPRKRVCFVIMGFGKKTDYKSGRTLDLDKSYQNMIKPAIEEAGMECLRADEIVHSGSIDMPMYEQIMKADVVIADISAELFAVAYELGIRHALRPFSTIVIAEDQIRVPFDINHVAIIQYKHLGEGLDYTEVSRMRWALTEKLRQLLEKTEVDSPVYRFLNLQPPQLKTGAPTPNAPVEQSQEQPDTLRSLIEQADRAVNAGDYSKARSVLAAARSMNPSDADVVRKLALATYRSKQPDAIQALNEARNIMKDLRPESTPDTETLGLWGTIHKRLYEQTQERTAADTAIRAYEKAFLLKNDPYNGINYAFLLNQRSRSSEPADAITDFVLARRTRREVIQICQVLLDAPLTEPKPDHFWLQATLAEATLGIGDERRAQDALNRALSTPGADQWMIESVNQQISRLRELLKDDPLRRVGLSEK